MDSDDLAPGWEVWNVEDGRWILAYRPDVFDGEGFPAACLPTITARKGTRDRRPGRDDPPPDAPWYVTLYLEPDVAGESDVYDDREAARAGARDLAARFADGDVDYRALYQVPREAYLAELDGLTGR